MSKNNTNRAEINQIIYAGGGILWRGTPFNSEIAIINRDRYGDEWCLPKGKQNEGETLEQTALREVQEETGCGVELYSFAMIERYKVEGRKKYVFYWHMILSGDNNSNHDTHEVKQMIWLPTKEAIQLLTHKDQKKMLKKLLPESSVFNFKIPPIAIQFQSLKAKRLEGFVVAYRAELVARKSMLENDELVWATNALELLDQAQNYLKAGDLDKSWKCFHVAQRMEIFTLDENRLASKAKIILNESDKLNDWRQKTIKSILEVGNRSLTKEEVNHAAMVRDEHFDNVAHRDKLFSKYLATLLKLSAVEIILIFIYINNFNNIDILLGVLLFGLFGGTVSAATKIPAKKESSRIPEQNYAINLSLFRVILGAASAVFIYVFLQTGLATKIFNFGGGPLDDSNLILIISFVAGFSERLLLSAVSTIINEKK